MGLKLKTFSEILNKMIGWMVTRGSKISNFTVGSVIRTILEAISLEIEAVYYEMSKGYKKALQHSVFYSFGFSKKSATPSSGMVTVRFKSELPYNMVIPQGYKFSTVPVRGKVLHFAATQDVACASGDTVANVPVECTTPGTIGNVPSGAIQICVTPLPFTQSVFNRVDFTNGQEEEDIAEVKKRFTEYIQTLSKGTVSAVQYGCLTVQGVTGVYVEERIGVLDIYIHDINGDLPTALENSVRETLLDYRAGGVEVRILPVNKRPVDLSVQIILNSGFDDARYQKLVQESIADYLNSYTVATSLMRADLIRFVMNIDTVAIQNVNIDLSEDRIVQNSEKIRAGNITVVVL